MRMLDRKITSWSSERDSTGERHCWTVNSSPVGVAQSGEEIKNSIDDLQPEPKGGCPFIAKTPHLDLSPVACLTLTVPVPEACARSQGLVKPRQLSSQHKQIYHLTYQQQTKGAASALGV